MSAPGREIELKFLLDRADIAALLAALPAGETAVKAMQAIYYDTAGDTLRYTITMDQFGPQGASTKGVVELLEAWSGKVRTIGHIDLMFSVLENNMAGIEFPEGNFVFGEAFKTLMRNSGVLIPGE